MGFRGESVFLFVVLILCLHLVLSHGRSLLSKEDLEIEKQLKILNKPYVKSFKGDHGEIYDCVDMYKQPAFDNPLLKNHKLQIFPTTNKSMIYGFGPEKSCPEGTVIIRRTTKEDLIRVRSLQPQSLLRAQNAHLLDLVDPGNHYAMIIVKGTEGKRYYGARAEMDVFQPSPVDDGQISSAQILLTNGVGTGPDNSINVIQFGWNVHPRLYKDSATHIFTHWTSDGYQKTGCFNMLCPGYVQVHNRLGLQPGMLAPKNNLGLQISVTKDSRTGNWVLKAGPNFSETLGYFPKELFSNMDSAAQIQMGGLVYADLRDLSPPMGSGEFRGCEMRHVGMLQADRQFVAPPLDVTLFTDLPKEYYDISEPAATESDGFFFKFGGPGRG